MSEQSQDSPESRLATLFGAPEAAPQVEETTEPTPEPETQEQVAQTEDQPEAADDSEDFEDEGAVYKVPRELKAKLTEWKDGYLRRDHFTKKTQEVADIARQALAMAETIQVRQSFESETQKEREELAQIQGTLNQYKQVDWQNLDVDTYIKLKGQRDVLKERADEINGVLQGKQREVESRINEARNKALQEGHKYLQKVIPNFGKDHAEVAFKAAQEIGYTEPELKNALDARFLALSWKAAQYDKLQSGKSAAVASVQKAPPVVKPGATQPVADRKFKDTRASLKKTGSLSDAAKVFLMRGLK